MGTLKTSISNSSLNSLLDLDLNTTPPALEEVEDTLLTPTGSSPSPGYCSSSTSPSSASRNSGGGGRSSAVAAANREWHRHTTNRSSPEGWRVFDPVYGVIEAKTRDVWREQEKEALKKATAALSHRKLPPVRGMPISTPAPSPVPVAVSVTACATAIPATTSGSTEAHALDAAVTSAGTSINAAAAGRGTTQTSHKAAPAPTTTKRGKKSQRAAATKRAGGGGSVPSEAVAYDGGGDDGDIPSF